MALNLLSWKKGTTVEWAWAKRWLWAVHGELAAILAPLTPLSDVVNDENRQVGNLARDHVANLMVVVAARSLFSLQCVRRHPE